MSRCCTTKLVSLGYEDTEESRPSYKGSVTPRGNLHCVTRRYNSFFFFFNFWPVREEQKGEVFGKLVRVVGRNLKFKALKVYKKQFYEL
jgi:hypothetical protein